MGLAVHENGVGIQDLGCRLSSWLSQIGVHLIWVKIL